MKKTINGTVTQFLYDRLNPVQELNGSHTPAVVANLLTGLGIDEYITRTAGSTTSTFLADALGSTLGLVTANNGPIATSYTYQPFGAMTVGGSANGNTYEFTGRENDGTGLYFNRARYYSSTFQRFVSQDPIGFRGGDANLYAYVKNNPPNFADPLGRQVYPGPAAQQLEDQSGNMPSGPALTQYPPGEPGMYCAAPPPPPPPKCPHTEVPTDWLQPVEAGAVLGGGLARLATAPSLSIIALANPATGWEAAAILGGAVIGGAAGLWGSTENSYGCSE